MSQQMAVSADARALRINSVPDCSDRTDGRQGHFRPARVACLVRRLCPSAADRFARDGDSPPVAALTPAINHRAHHHVFFSTAVASRSTFESIVTRAFADGDNDRIAVAQTAACYPPRRLRLRHLSARRGSGDVTSLTEQRSRGAKRDSLSMIVDETNVARLDRSDGPAIDAVAPRDAASSLLSRIRACVPLISA